MDLRKKSYGQDIGTIVVVIAMLLIILIWWLQPVETTEEDFTVTIDCRVVLMNPEEFSENIITICRNKVRFIKPPEQLSV